MGNTPNKPTTKKTTGTGGELPNGVKWGVSSMQGWKVQMEDAHIAEEIREVWDRKRGTMITLKEPHYFFSVLDGHGGEAAAKYASENLLDTFKLQPEFIRYARTVRKTRQEEHPKSSSKRSSKTRPDLKNNSRTSKRSEHKDGQITALLQRALENTFIILDFQFLSDVVERGAFELAPASATLKSSTGVADDTTEEENPIHTASRQHSASGTTVTATFVTPDMIFCANVGDSRTIIDASPLSTDHKPSLPGERQRILDAMGMVNFDRVDGELAVSRAIGDFEFKAYNQSHLTDGGMDMESKRSLAQDLKVSPFPEVTWHQRLEADQALILACDGIWDVMTNLECHELVQALCEEGETNVGRIAEEILDTCLAKGSRDNMTVIVGLLPGQVFGKGDGVFKRRNVRTRKLVQNLCCQRGCKG